MSSRSRTLFAHLTNDELLHLAESMAASQMNRRYDAVTIAKILRDSETERHAVVAQRYGTVAGSVTKYRNRARDLLRALQHSPALNGRVQLFHRLSLPQLTDLATAVHRAIDWNNPLIRRHRITVGQLRQLLRDTDTLGTEEAAHRCGITRHRAKRYRTMASAILKESET